MEQGVFTVDLVELYEFRVVFDFLSIFAKICDVFPKFEVHASQREIHDIWMVDT